MPILAVVDTTPGEPPRVIPTDDRRFEFWNLDGTDVLQWSGSEWIIASGIQGIRMAPREVITDTVPGLPGGRLREIRTAMRTVVLPFVVVADSGDYRDHLAQMAHLRSYADFRSVDYASAEGTFDLVAIADGSQRFLRCTYVDGMEGVDGISDGAGTDFSTFDMKLLAVSPFWRGDQWSTPTVSLPGTRPFLSTNSADHPWGLSPSVAIGSGMPVVVGGDVPSPAVVEIIGPATTTHITSPSGLDVTLGAVGAGETLVLDTGRRKALTVDGVTDWTLLGDSPQWADFRPGPTTVSVTMTGATTATRARVYGTELWETAW